MRDECERSGEESTMPAPEKRGEERLLHAASHKREYPPAGKRNLFPEKAPYAEGGCNGFLA